MVKPTDPRSRYSSPLIGGGISGDGAPDAVGSDGAAAYAATTHIYPGCP